MFKKVILFFLIILSIFLVSCSKKKKSEVLELKFGSYVLKLDKNYYLSNVDIKSKDIEIIYSYKEKSKNPKFSPSLLIAKYTKFFPEDEKEFFSIMVDKLKKELIGVKIFGKGEFSVGKQKAFYVKYKIDENIFGGNEGNIYYGLQVYIISKKDKVVYIISYVCLEEEKINNILDKIKNLQVK